jgi:hypothetical protein
MGARFGQGWLFGKPGPLPAQPASRPGGMYVTPRRAHEPTGVTPFQIVSDRRQELIGDKQILLERSRQLEAEAGDLGAEGVLLSTFQDMSFFTPATAARYRELASRLAFVGAFGVGMPEEPVAGVRGGTIEEAEPLRGEWNVIVLGPHFAGAFVAADLGDDGPDPERRFDFCMTYDRNLVVDAARALMARIVPR